MENFYLYSEKISAKERKVHYFVKCHYSIFSKTCFNYVRTLGKPNVHLGKVPHSKKKKKKIQFEDIHFENLLILNYLFKNADSL